MQATRSSSSTIVEDSPIGDAFLTSGFGPRPSFTIPNALGTGTFTSLDFHFGSDLVKIVGPTDGAIIEALRAGLAQKRDDDPRDAGGLVVRLKHDKYETEYWHTKLDGFRPPTGAQIVVGQGIAQASSTGLSTGPHLHLVLRRIGALIKYYGFNPAHIYETNHIDPLSEEGLSFFNGKLMREWTLLEILAFARAGIAKGNYRIEERAGSDLLVVETTIG